MLGRNIPLLLLISTLVGCGSEPAPNDFAVVPFQVNTTGPTPFCDIPWPSDLYLDANGRVGTIPNLALVSSTNQAIQAGLSSLDGFGRASGGLFLIPFPVDSASLPHDYATATDPSAAVFFVDVDPDTNDAAPYDPKVK